MISKKNMLQLTGLLLVICAFRLNADDGQTSLVPIDDFLADRDSDHQRADLDEQKERERLRKLGPIPLRSLHIPPVVKNNFEGPSTVSAVIPDISAQDIKGTVAPVDTRSIWLYKSALENAPKLLQGLCTYWAKYANIRRVVSYNRLLLVGKPGTGKTTLARAIAWRLGYGMYMVPASSLIGRFRNQTAANIRDCFKKIVEDKRPTIVVIDEVHKLFEHHADEHSDQSINAAAFWLTLDYLEACAPHIIVIGTANSVSALPAEIQSRFHGKVITIPLPGKQHRLQALTEMIDHDESFVLGNSVNVAYIMQMLDTLPDSSLRDIQLLLDSAKMFRYAHGAPLLNTEIMVLEKEHFAHAVAQLRIESVVLHKGWSATVLPALKNSALALSVAVNMGVITKMIYSGIVEFRGSQNNGARPAVQ